MSNREISRRGVIAVLAAAGAGKMSSISGASGSEQQQVGTADEDFLEDYANRVGRVLLDGLEEAFSDWSNGILGVNELDAVIDAWADGERVMEDGLSFIPWNDDITEDTILEAEPDDEPGYTPGDQVVYQVQSGTIDVEAELVIEPGVAIEFSQGTEMYVRSSGTLIAEGTQNDDILLTSTRGQRGWWNALYIDSVDLDNTMEYVTVEYAGGGSRNGCLDVASRSRDSGLIEVSNCTFRRSASYGLYLDSSGDLAGGSGDNTYTRNRSGAARATMNNMETLSGSSTFLGNDDDAEFVRVSLNGLSGEGPDEDSSTWDALDVPYRMDGEDRTDNLTLTIEEGAEFEFTQASRLRFHSGTRLRCEGTEEEPILFTATREQRGWWDGIRFTSTDNESVMRHTTIEYGGNNLRGNLALATGRNASEIEITDCTFRKSADYGMWVENPTDLTEARNTYTDNANGAVRISTINMSMLSETSTFAGNDEDYVLVNDMSISGDGPDQSQRTWDALDVPYRMDGDDHEIEDMELVIQPGATFEFTEAGRLRFHSGTRMNISGWNQEAPEGEMENRITFTGTTKQRGWWDGLRVTTEDGENLMEYVDIEYGGNNLPGNLALATGRNSSKLELNHCRLRHSDAYGMWVENPTELEERWNTYTDNASGAVRISSMNIHMLSDTSTFAGNDEDYVYVNDTDIDSGDQTWDAIDVPYRMDGDDHEVQGIRVDIDRGATFEFTESAQLRFRSGSFGMQGTADDPITFTGTDKTRGWWNGLRVTTTSSTNVMEHVIVEYGGNNLPANLNVARGRNDGNIQQMQNCTFRHSGGYGIWAADGSTFPGCEANTYTGNTDGAVRFRTQNLHYLSDTSDFTGNDDDVVQVYSDSLSGSNVPAGEDKAVWDGINVPYRFDDADRNDIYTDLKIDPGAELRFEEFGEIRFHTDSTLEIVGAEDDPIIFTASEDRPDFVTEGWWKGIHITSPSSVNQMQHVTLEYGVDDPDSAPYGLVDVGGDSRSDGAVNMTDCTLRNSKGDGIFVEEDSSANADVCTANEFDSDTILGVDCNVE